MSQGSVLVAEDEAFIQGLFKEFLEARGYDVSVAATVVEARDIVGRAHIDAVVLDRHMPGGDSLDALDAAVRTQASVIVVTGVSDDEIESQLRARGAFMVLQKPIDLRRLADVVAEGVAASQQRRTH